jgi:chromosome segregation ATPase
MSEPSDLEIAMNLCDPSKLVDGCKCDPESGYICECCFTHSTLAQCKRDITRLTAQVDRLNKTCDRWHKLNTRIAKENTRLRAERNAAMLLTEDNAKLLAERDAAQEQCGGLILDRNKAQRERDEARDEARGWRDAAAIANRDREIAEANATQAIDEATQLRKERDGAISEVTRLRATDTYHRDTIGKLNSHIQEQEEVIVRGKAEVTQLRAEIGRFQNELNLCRQSAASLVAQIGVQGTALDAVKIERDVARSSRAELWGRITAWFNNQN